MVSFQIYPTKCCSAAIYPHRLEALSKNTDSRTKDISLCQCFFFHVWQWKNKKRFQLQLCRFVNAILMNEFVLTIHCKSSYSLCAIRSNNNTDFISRAVLRHILPHINLINEWHREAVILTVCPANRAATLRSMSMPIYLVSACAWSCVAVAIALCLVSSLFVIITLFSFCTCYYGMLINFSWMLIVHSVNRHHFREIYVYSRRLFHHR